MRIGELRHKITIKIPSETVDAYGQIIDESVPLFSTFAAIEPLKGREFQEGKQTQSEVSHKISIRYRTGVKPNMQVVYLGRVFSIQYIKDPGEQHKVLEMYCRELI